MTDAHADGRSCERPSALLPRVPRPRERDVVAAITRYLRTHDAWVEKTHGGAFTRTGIPDLIGCYRGQFFALEAKRDESAARTGVTAAQTHALAEIRAHGGYAAVVWSVAQVRALLIQIDATLYGARNDKEPDANP